jgi:hypothetical protein
MVTLYYSFFKNPKPYLRMFCFTGNSDALGIEICSDVPVIVVKKITNVL